MDRQLSKFGVKNVQTQCKSFLDSDPMDPQYAETEYILLDPSVCELTACAAMIMWYLVWLSSASYIHA